MWGSGYSVCLCYKVTKSLGHEEISRHSPPAHPASTAAPGPWESWGPASDTGYWVLGWRTPAPPSAAGHGLCRVLLWTEWHPPGWLHGVWSADREKSQLITHLIKSTVYFVAYPCIMSEIWVCSLILLRTRLDSFYHPNENHADMVAAVCASLDILLYYDLLFRAMASLRLLWKALGTHILNN